MTTLSVAKALSFPLYGVCKSASRLLSFREAARERQKTYGAARRELFDDGNETDPNYEGQDDRVGGGMDEGASFVKQSVPTGGALVLFLFLSVFVVLVPAIQAFSCGQNSSLGMPGWIWGFLILFFWPLGVIWLVLQGGCSSLQGDGFPDAFSSASPYLGRIG